MKGKSTIRKSLWFLCMGMIFLCNPVVALVDVLPDFLGYLFLIFALLPFSDINDHLEEAFKRFKSLIWFGLVQVFAEILIYGYLAKSQEEMNAYEQPVWILTFSFLFLVMQYYFLIPALRRLFLGFDRILSTLDSRLSLAQKRGKSVCERLISASTFMVIGIALFATLPEFSVLSGGNAVTAFDWFGFVGMFRILCAVPAVIISVTFLIRFLRFFFSLYKDCAVMEKMQADYQIRLQKQGRTIAKRKTGFAFQFFFVGSFFLAQLSLNHHEVLPNAVCSLFFILGWLFLKDWVKKNKTPLVFAILLFFVSIAKMICLEKYLIEYVPLDSIHFPNAYDAYLPVKILGLAEALFTLGFLISFLWMLYSFMRSSTTVIYDKPELTEKATKELHNELSLQMIPLWIFAIIISAGSFFNAFLTPKYLWMWWIPFTFSLLFAGALSDFLNLLAEEAQTDAFIRSDEKTVDD